MRKQLTTKNVSYLVVHPSNTSVKQDLTVDDILRRRALEGYPDIGFHYVITRDGGVHSGIPINEAGTHTAQYDDRAVGVLLIGGKTTRGKPSDNYTKEQKVNLKALLEYLSNEFPKAKAVGIGELWGGTSPHFSIQELLNGSET